MGIVANQETCNMLGTGSKTVCIRRTAAKFVHGQTMYLLESGTSVKRNRKLLYPIRYSASWVGCFRVKEWTPELARKAAVTTKAAKAFQCGDSGVYAWELSGFAPMAEEVAVPAPAVWNPLIKFNFNDAVSIKESSRSMLEYVKKKPQRPRRQKNTRMFSA